MSYTLHVKTLAGSILPVEIPVRSHYLTIRKLVFQALPDDIRPDHELQVSLLYDVEEPEPEPEPEVAVEDEKMVVEEFASLLIAENTYDFSMALVEEGMMYCPCNGEHYPYNRYRVWVKNGDRREWSRTFLVKKDATTLDCIYPEWNTLSIYCSNEDPEDNLVELHDCRAVFTPSGFFRAYFRVCEEDEEGVDSLHAFFVKEMVRIWDQIKSEKRSGPLYDSWAESSF